MATINFNNVTSDNGHNRLSASTNTPNINYQMYMQTGHNSTKTDIFTTPKPLQQHHTKQQVNVRSAPAKGNRADHKRSVAKSNSTTHHQHNFMDHHYMQHHYMHHQMNNMMVLNYGNLLNYDFISIKSKIGVEFRRYSLRKEDVQSFDSFYEKIESFHQLSTIPFVIFYTDSEDFLLPINNDDNLAKAISSAKHISLHTTNCNNNLPVIIRRPYLKLFIEKKGIFLDYYNGNLSGKYKKNQLFKGFSNFLPSNEQGLRPSIGMPGDFRQISSIIDADKLPATRRRVVLKRGGSDRPLGFYIRDGTYQRMNSHGGIEKHYGIFISRLVPGGLAESTNLLAENDEILEVNGIAVGKSKRLDQVRDMMVANSSNLIITIRPAKPYNQYPANYNRMRNRTMNTPGGRDRLPSTQSTGSDLAEDFIRHHMN